MMKLITGAKGTGREMKLFLLKLLLFVVVWETLYVFVLKPVRIPDEFLTTTLTAAVTAALNVTSIHHYSWIPEPGKPSCLVQENYRTVLVIFDDCNGFDLYIIYLAFIFLLPYPLMRKLTFSVLGAVAIFVGNVLRCLALYGVYTHFRSSFEFNHHYVFTIIMYLIIFCGWVLYTKPKLSEIN